MKRYIIFGAGRVGKRYFEAATKAGIEIVAFCDNNANRWGSEYCGRKIISQDMLLHKDYAECKFFVAIRQPEEIYKQLDLLGIAYSSDLKREIYIKRNRLFFENAVPGACVSNNSDHPQLSIVIDARKCTEAELQNCIASVLSNEIPQDKEIVLWKKGMTCPKISGSAAFLLDGSSCISVGSLDYLMTKFEQKRCLLGAKEVDNNWKILQAGFMLEEQCLKAYGENEDCFGDKYCYVKEVHCLKNNGIIMSQEQWEVFRNKLLGGVDEILACIEMQQEAYAQGYHLYVQPYALLLTDSRMAKIENEKMARFWKQSSPIMQPIKKEQVLVLDYSIAEYDTNAGHRSTHSYMQLLRELDKEIVYLLDYLDETSPYLEYYQQQEIFVVYDEEYNVRTESFLRMEAQCITYAFVNRPQIADKYVPILRNNPNMTIVHYGSDLHYLRMLREYELTRNEKIREEAMKMKEIEYSLVRKVDFTGYPSEVEVDILRKEFPDANIQYFPIYYYEAFPKISERREKSGIMFVGSYGHSPNVDAACWLVEEILPEIRKRGITDKLYLVGSGPTEKVCSLACDDIIVTGYVTEQQLEELYKKCRMAIVPLRYGAGMKGKVLEAMYKGIPLVTTDIGAEGLKGVEKVIGIGNTVREIVDRVEQIYKYSDEEVVQITENAQAYLKEHFDKQRIKEMLLAQMNYKKL